MQQELIEMLDKMVKYFDEIPSDSYYYRETGAILNEAGKLVEKAKNSAKAPAVPAEIDVRTILLGIVPGDGNGYEVYAKNVDDVVNRLTMMGEQLEAAEMALANYTATPAAPAVPQGNDPAWTLAAKVREALDRKACPGYYMDVAVEAVVHNYTPAAPSQEPVTLRDYADSLIEAGHEFWKACRRDAGGGAVRWLSCDDGTLIVFTRGEYRDAIMGAVGGYRATEVFFEDQGNDEQGGVVACAVTSQPTMPDTDELESALERLVERCNTDQILCNDDAVIHAEATLKRIYKSRKSTSTPSAASQPVPLTDSYAGVIAWIGDKQCKRVLTESAIIHEHTPGVAMRNTAHQCVQEVIIAALREKEKAQ